MGQLSSKEKWFLAIVLFYIIYVTLPIFADLMAIPVYLPPVVVSVALAVLFFSDIISSKTFVYFVIYIVLLFLYNLVGAPIHVNGLDSSLNANYRIIIEIAWTLPSLLIFIILSQRDNYQLYKFVAYSSLICILISYTYILPLLRINSNILREDLPAEFSARPRGLPQYALMHSYTLLLPVLYLWTKLAVGKKKFVVLAVSIIVSYVVIRTSVTTSLLLMILTLFFVILFNPSRPSNSIAKFCVFIVAFVILYYTGVILWAIDSVMPFFDGTAVSYKLQDFHDSIVGGSLQGGSITARMDYHRMSRLSFWSNPIFGGGSSGGHSKILDMLGCTGLVVFIPFAMIVVTTIKTYLSKMTGDYSKSCLLFEYALAFVYLYEKSVFSESGWLFMIVIVPSLIITLITPKEEKGV